MLPADVAVLWQLALGVVPNLPGSQLPPDSPFLDVLRSLNPTAADIGITLLDADPLPALEPAAARVPAAPMPRSRLEHWASDTHARLWLLLAGGIVYGTMRWVAPKPVPEGYQAPEIEIAGISGTSAGALNGAALKAGLEEIRERTGIGTATRSRIRTTPARIRRE